MLEIASERKACLINVGSPSATLAQHLAQHWFNVLCLLVCYLSNWQLTSTWRREPIDLCRSDQTGKITYLAFFPYCHYRTPDIVRTWFKWTWSQRNHSFCKEISALFVMWVLLNWLLLFFIHLKLELLTQFPASNELKIVLFLKNRHLQYWIIGWLAEHLRLRIYWKLFYHI